MTLALLTALALAQGAPETAVEPPPAGRNAVALVVGLSSYDALPDSVELDFARSDAATVAKALTEQAHFQRVFTLLDGQATREAILNTLRTEVAQLVGPKDVFVLYFVGHGVGADLDLPVLLAYDSSLENGQEDGLELNGMARDLLTWTKAGTTLIVTDAIHRNQLDGIFFYGPSADQWPSMPPGTAILSATHPSEAGGDGVFGPAFALAMSGAADANRDTYVTAAELHAFLVERLAPEGQVPVLAGDYSPNAVLAAGVNPDIAPVTQEDGTIVLAPVYPEYPIDKAKFVWTEGAAHAVRCRESELVTCTPSCYVWDFTSGPCELSAVVDGTPLTGEVVVLQRGRYSCKRYQDKLVCSGP
ncbi:MAG: caspase family protein [Deltaproteobacteria bacterium]|nr:caspase family protein [Deltaproteobacteria bacterium]